MALRQIRAGGLIYQSARPYIYERTVETDFYHSTEIVVIVADSHDAGLDDVGHNLHFLVRLSILIVWEKGKCYIK